jgi:hypothetical protein
MVDTPSDDPTSSASGPKGPTFLTLHGVPRHDPPPEGQQAYILDPQGAWHPERCSRVSFLAAAVSRSPRAGIGSIGPRMTRTHHHEATEKARPEDRRDLRRCPGLGCSRMAVSSLIPNDPPYRRTRHVTTALCWAHAAGNSSNSRISRPMPGAARRRRRSRQSRSKRSGDALPDIVAS